jgi:hypothetical protein
MKEKLISLLNIKRTESNYVFDLLRIQFFIGFANAFINIAAFTYFIHEFSISVLPYAYIAIAAGLLLINIGYQKLERRFSPIHLLKYLIVFSAAIMVFFWSGFLIGKTEVLIFLLLVWSTLFYMVTGYAYWGLASLVFNVRESRRVFSIIGAGDIPTKLLGYLSAPLLVPIIGLQNLLLFSVVGLLIGQYFINRLLGKQSWKSFATKNHHAKHVQPVAERGKPWMTLLFKNKLIFAISLLSILSYNVFNFVDFTFISQVKLKYEDVGMLASFIATFFALGRIVALVLKLSVSSRLIEKLGIVACLLITPVTLFVFCLIFVGFNTGYEYSLYIFGMMALLAEVLRSTIQEPAFFILFQPLNEHQRLEGHIIAKGYMLPPSLLIVGISLILMKQFGIELSILFSTQILLLHLGVWALIIFMVKKEYLKSLHKAIAKGFFNGMPGKVYDATTIDILLHKIETSNESEIIYALKLLETAEYPKMVALLEQQLFSGKPEVIKYALHRLDESNQIKPALLKQLLSQENAAAVNEYIVSVLCKHDVEFLETISNSITEQEVGVRKSIVTHLLSLSEFSYFLKAAKEIERLAQSALAEDRELALSIIGDLPNLQFTGLLQKLVEDPEPAVKRSALIAACKLKTKKLLPAIIALMKDPPNRYLVLQGLMQYGDTLFEDIKSLPQEELLEYEAELIKVAGRTKGHCSTEYLFKCLEHQTRFADKTIHAFWLKGYQAEAVPVMHIFQQMLALYLNRGAEKIAYHSNIPSFADQYLVKNSLAAEIKNDLSTALQICAILYHKKEINRVLELVENNDKHKLFNAMEMLEMVLPKKTAKQINYLFDYVLEPAAAKRPKKQLNSSTFFSEIVVANGNDFNSWTKAVCLFCSFKNQDVEFIQRAEGVKELNNNLVTKETLAYILKQQVSYAHN